MRCCHKSPDHRSLCTSRAVTHYCSFCVCQGFHSPCAERGTVARCSSRTWSSQIMYPDQHLNHWKFSARLSKLSLQKKRFLYIEKKKEKGKKKKKSVKNPSLEMAAEKWGEPYSCMSSRCRRFRMTHVAMEMLMV